MRTTLTGPRRVLGGEVAFGFESGGAAGAAAVTGLAIGVVGDIAGGKDALDVGGGAAVALEDVAVVIEIDDAIEKLGVGDVANGHKNTGRLRALAPLGS